VLRFESGDERCGRCGIGLSAGVGSRVSEIRDQEIGDQRSVRNPFLVSRLLSLVSPKALRAKLSQSRYEPLLARVHIRPSIANEAEEGDTEFVRKLDG